MFPTHTAPPAASILPEAAARPGQLFPGLLLCAACAAAASALSRIDWLRGHGLGTLTLAIVLGMLIGNGMFGRLAGLAHRAGPGMTFSRQTLLRAGVVLYGMRLTLHDVAGVGTAGIVIDAVMLVTTFGLAVLIGTRVLGLERNTAMLVGAGSAICGAAAVMATQTLLRARAEQLAVAVASVVVFGTVAIFLYPALFLLDQHWPVIGGGRAGFGVYVGSTVHEVAQVVAASRSIGSGVVDTALIAKMVRVMMLAPFLLGLSAWLTAGARPESPRGSATPGVASVGWKSVPWFSLGFVGLVVVNSLVPPAPFLRAAGAALDDWLLAMAMAGLGLATHLGAVRKAGARPLALALILFLWLVVGGAVVNHCIPVTSAPAILVPGQAR